MRRAVRAAALTAAVLLYSRLAFADSVAFPGAQGFGSNATGGRAGSVYVVTNLNDSGTGSFRDAVSHSGRIVVFAVGGYVNLSSAVSVSSNITILGQTAPGQGIGFEGREISFSTSSNDIVQYIRAREGSADPSAKASINLGDSSNMILDHVSAEYSQYDNIDAVGNNGVNDVTLQNSMLADPIKAQQFNMHTEGDNVTYLNNLWVNAHNRNPLAKSDTQYVNNVVYNYQAGYTTGNSVGVYSYDILNNYFITGPSTTQASNAWYQLDSNQSAFSSGNLLDSNKNGKLDGAATTPGGVKVLAAEWAPSTKYLPLLSTAAAYAFDVAHAGASLQRDAVDTQVVSQVQSLGTSGSIYNTENSNGIGFSTITGGVAPTDTDKDGVPDAWEKTHGMNSTVADSLVLNPLGYAMVEQYAQELGDEYVNQTWSSSSGQWTGNAWSSAPPGIYDHALIRGNGINDGSVTVSAGAAATAFDVSIGGNGASAGETLNVFGGALTVQDTIYIGDQGNGTMSVNGGSVLAVNVQVGNTVFDSNGVGTTYAGTLNLTGGILQTNQLVLGGGTPGNWTTGGTINWSGGTLKAFNSLKMSAPATLGAGGGILDSNGVTATISGLLGGSGGLKKIGTGTLVLSADNTYTGPTTVSAGIVAVASLGNGNAPSPLGQSTNAAPNLVLDGGTLQFTGTGGTDRLFTLTGNGGTLDASGTSNIAFTSTGTVALSTANVTLILTGTNGGHNTFSPSLGDPGAAFKTSVTKSGTGKWTFSSSGTKTYSGDTHITLGTLEALAANAFSANSNVVIDSGATLDLRNQSSETINALVGAGAVVNSFSGSSTSSFTIGANNGSGTFSGGISSGATLNVFKAGSGTETLTGANTYIGATTVSAGTLTIDYAGSVTSSTLIAAAQAKLNMNGSAPPTAAITSSGTTKFGASNSTGILVRNIGSLAITNGGLASITVPSAHANRTLLVTGALNFDGAINGWQGKLDLTGNDMIVSGGNLANIADQLQSGFNADVGYWNGSAGIISSTAASDSKFLTTLGYRSGGSPLDGVNTTANDVLLKYTYYGDADLNGAVNGADYHQIDLGFGSHGALTGWQNGDFNYDGFIDGSDYSIIDNTFNQLSFSGATPLAIVASPTSAIPVPEPGGAALVSILSLSFLRRRARARR